MAPELFSDECDGHHSSKVDVYAFGVLLYTLFSENRKLDDNPERPVRSPQQLLMRVAKGARFIRTPEIPEFYWNLITHCWAQDPAARPTFSDIVRLLKEHKGELGNIDLAEFETYEKAIFSSK
jgi:serine/threonine protein kinase